MLLDTAGLADALGVSADYIRRLTRSGQIPYHAIGAGTIRYHLPDILSASRVNRHSDDEAVDRFADAMRDKMRISREEYGRAGWETMTDEALRQRLEVAVEKGDPVDVANYAMMIWGRSGK